MPDQSALFPPEAAQLRWFLTPWEAKCALLGPSLSGDPSHRPLAAPPFSPPRDAGGGEYPVPGSLSGSAPPHVSDGLRGILAHAPRPSLSWLENRFRQARFTCFLVVPLNPTLGSSTGTGIIYLGMIASASFGHSYCGPMRPCF